jgi:hypothetical protein
MNEILLIRPDNTISAREIPLGLIHTGTVLSQRGYVVTSIDAGRQHNYKKLISRKIDDVLVIGITCQTSELINAIEISNHIKHISNLPIIWGGWHLFRRKALLHADARSHSDDQSQDYDCWKHYLQQRINLAISRVDEFLHGIRNTLCAAGRISYP